MAIHKLHFDDYDELECQLYAIHTTLEDYRLAFFINQLLPVLLKKSKEAVIALYKKNRIAFSKFEYEDVKNDLIWTLIQNKTLTEEQNNREASLFTAVNQNIVSKNYFVPEMKKVDYFLKINAPKEIFETQLYINRLVENPWISACYNVDVTKLKSKNNLIF